MTTEASGPTPEFNWLTAANPEVAGDGDGNRTIHQRDDLTEEEALRQLFIASGGQMVVNLKTQTVPDRETIEVWRFSTGIDRVAFKFNQEARKGTIGLDEIIEAGRAIALVCGDDTFEERLATIPEIMGDLTPGTYIFPIDSAYDYTGLMEEVVSETGEVSYLPRCPRVGRVMEGRDGQPAIIPYVWSKKDSRGVTRPGISLKVIVDLGDHTESEVEVDVTSGTPENINVDRSTIKSVLRERVRAVLSKYSPEVLEIQSLAESFGIMGEVETKDELQQVAHTLAVKQFDVLLSGRYTSVWERAMQYLVLHDPEFMCEKYDEYARDYAVTGALLGDSKENQTAQLFFRLHTGATEWVANKTGRVATIMEPYDDPIPYPGLFRTKALQKFLERGRQLAEERLAAELAATQSERSITDVHLPETDEKSPAETD